MTKPQWLRLVRGNTPSPRSSHSMSFLHNKLYVFGGEERARVPLDSTLHILDNAVGEAGEWRQVSAENVRPRVAHAQATITVEGRSYIYIFGGRQGIAMNEKALNDLHSFDLATESWTEVQKSETTGEWPSPRSFHQMVGVGQVLYIFGGCGNDGRMSDLHSFDVTNRTWTCHGHPKDYTIRGRGGASMVVAPDGKALHIVAGFAGEEMADAFVFDIEKGKWHPKSQGVVPGLRPRSVAIGHTLPSSDRMIIFGGEVDPSAKGHEGAGLFANDIVHLQTEPSSPLDTLRAVSLPSRPCGGEAAYPEARGWSAGAVGTNEGADCLFVFGGLAGNDVNPKRLGDLWRCTFE